MRCIYASEVASLLGLNRFVDPVDAYNAMIERNIQKEEEYENNIKKINEQTEKEKMEAIERGIYRSEHSQMVISRSKLTKKQVSDAIAQSNITIEDVNLIENNNTDLDEIDTDDENNLVNADQADENNLVNADQADENNLVNADQDDDDTTDIILEKIYSGEPHAASKESIDRILGQFEESTEQEIPDDEVKNMLCNIPAIRQKANNKPHLQQEFGCLMEKIQLKDKPSQVVLKRRLNDDWIIYGKADSIQNDVVVEVKNRMNKIYPKMFINDKVQLMTYIWMADLDKGMLEQHCKGETRRTELEYEPDWYDDILSKLEAVLSSE